MKRLTWLLALAVASTGMACQTDVNLTVYTQTTLALAPGRSADGSCGPISKPTRTGDLVVIGHGEMDVKQGFYILAPMIVNGTAAGNEPNQHLMFLHGFDTEIVAVNNDQSRALVARLDSANLLRRTQLDSDGIGPGGLSSLTVVAVDTEQSKVMADALAASGGNLIQFTVRIRPFGVMDEQEVEGAPYDFPIDVCSGCLQRDLGPCSKFFVSSVFPDEGSCGLAQDGAVFCCEDDDQKVVCPGQGTMPDPIMTPRATSAP